ITYIPAVYWLGGYACFWLGAKCIRKKVVSPSNYDLVGRSRVIVGLTVVGIFALLMQLAILARLYGGIPFLAFFSGGMTVVDIDQLTLQKGFLGQQGFFLMSQFFIDALMLLLLIVGIQRDQRY